MTFLRDWLGRAHPTGSRSVAKERLKLVLEYDRAQLTPAQLEQIRVEIVTVISRHVNVRREDVAVSLESGGRLVVDIPLDGSRKGRM
jgi:cell division topological specificity factor